LREREKERRREEREKKNKKRLTRKFTIAPVEKSATLEGLLEEQKL
jgi:hypothetical protein